MTVTEGAAATTTNAVFTVSLSKPTDQVVTVQYQTADGTSTIANGDYVASSGTLTFTAKVPTQQLTVVVNGDTRNEANETFFVNLSNPTGGPTIGDGQGVGTITDDDATPTLTISPSPASLNVIEGNAGTTPAVFTVTLSAVSGQTVTVNYATADGTARVDNGDYTALSGTLTFPAKGATTQQITVQVAGDTRQESNETITVTLSGAVNATIAGTGVGTILILNDDGPPTLTINDATVSEGNAGTTNAVFTVTLSPVSGLNATVNYSTTDSTAKLANNDYVAASGTLTFPARAP